MKNRSSKNWDGGKKDFYTYKMLRHVLSSSLIIKHVYNDQFFWRTNFFLSSNCSRILSFFFYQFRGWKMGSNRFNFSNFEKKKKRITLVFLCILKRFLKHFFFFSFVITFSCANYWKFCFTISPHFPSSLDPNNYQINIVASFNIDFFFPFLKKSTKYRRF